MGDERAAVAKRNRCRTGAVTASRAALLALLYAASGCTGRASGAAAARASLDNPGSSSDGGAIYLTNCSSCHQADGRGVPGIFPALAGNPAVTGDARAVIAVVALGRRRSAPAPGTFGGVMPAWHGLLSDTDIADVVTYIRFAWHNDAGPVSQAQVRAVTAAR